MHAGTFNQTGATIRTSFLNLDVKMLLQSVHFIYSIYPTTCYEDKSIPHKPMERINNTSKCVLNVSDQSSIFYRFLMYFLSNYEFLAKCNSSFPLPSVFHKHLRQQAVFLPSSDVPTLKLYLHKPAKSVCSEGQCILA